MYIREYKVKRRQPGYKMREEKSGKQEDPKIVEEKEWRAGGQ